MCGCRSRPVPCASFRWRPCRHRHGRQAWPAGQCPGGAWTRGRSGAAPAPGQFWRRRATPVPALPARAVLLPSRRACCPGSGSTPVPGVRWGAFRPGQPGNCPRPAPAGRCAPAGAQPAAGRCCAPGQFPAPGGQSAHGPGGRGAVALGSAPPRRAAWRRALRAPGHRRPRAGPDSCAAIFARLLLRARCCPGPASTGLAPAAGARGPAPSAKGWSARQQCPRLWLFGVGQAYFFRA